MKLLNIFLGALQAQSYRSYDYGNYGRGRPRRPTATPSVVSNTENIPSYGPIRGFTRIDLAKKKLENKRIKLFVYEMKYVKDLTSDVTTGTFSSYLNH